MDWMSFLNDHGVDFVTMGPNTKRGEVSVRCPFCGDEDPSEHMGISLTSENWGCYRDAAHRGRRPYWLVRALMGCSATQACHLVDAYSKADPDGLDDALAALTAPATPLRPLKPLVLPSEFQPLAHDGSRVRFWRYLERRGFNPVGTLPLHYKLLCATTGKWKDRIIFPLYQEGKLLGWTGRALADKPHSPRYLSSSDAVKKTVLFEDNLQKIGRCLFIVEGPFDALKLDWYGLGIIRATCGFGTSLSIDQIAILTKIIPKFQYVVVMFDRGALTQAMAVADNWPSKATVSIAPPNIKDPGEMTKEYVKDLALRMK